MYHFEPWISKPLYDGQYELARMYLLNKSGEYLVLRYSSPVKILVGV